MSEIDLVMKSQIFNKLDQMDVLALLRCLNGKVKKNKKNSFIVSQGDSSKNCVLILSGIARSYATDENGEYNIIMNYSKDHIFGLDYLYKNQNTFKESLVALSDCTVLSLDLFRMLTPCENRCKRHIEILKKCFEEFSRQTLETKNRIIQICETKTRNKILRFLTEEGKKKKRNSFTIDFDRQQLADYLGVERSALCAELSSMKKEGLIDYDKNYFQVIKKYPYES